MTKTYKLNPSPGSDRWISKPFAELVASEASGVNPIDVLIIGSGYGGAVAANSFAGSSNEAGETQRVVLLERGKEYLPGSFPTTTSEAFIHFRGNINGTRLDGLGLFDFRVGPDVNVVLANGLGGGSLINAGVMETPKPEVFDQRWPNSFQAGDALKPYFEPALDTLGACRNGALNTVVDSAFETAQPAQKRAVLKQMGATLSASGSARDAALTVAMDKVETSGGVSLSPCNQCGDCTTGCNFGAKESLDTNLLAAAAQKGAELYTGATALTIAQTASGLWEVELRYTDDLLHQRHGACIKLHCKQLVLAAGALGSTELLLRSQAEHGLCEGQQNLGKGFSANGDAVYIAYDTKQRVNTMPQELSAPDTRATGPTISAVIDVDLGEGKASVGASSQVGVIEDLAIAAPLYNFVAEMLTNSNMLYHIGDFDLQTHRYDFPQNDPVVSNPYKHANTMWFAAMGDDGAAGRVELAEEAGNRNDAAVRIVWSDAKELPLFETQRKKIQGGLDACGIGGRLMANPTWEPLPPDLAAMVKAPKGPITSTHPLGGCRMADDAADGVVNEYGQVYRSTSGNEVYPGLVVLDGSIIPSALCTNPALTITAVAQRACDYLSPAWKLSPSNKPVVSLGERPILKDVAADIARRAALPPAEISIKERLVGEFELALDNFREPLVAELTVSYHAKSFDDLFSVNTKGQLQGTCLPFVTERDEFGGTPSQLRLYRRGDWARLASDTLPRAQRNRLANELAVFRATVSGDLTLLRHQASTPLKRILRGLGAWLLNRGVRDSWQGLRGGGSEGMNLWQTAFSAIKGASHSGAMRLFEYQATLNEVLQDKGVGWQSGAQLKGEKRLTYSRPSNPWRQLLELHMTEVPTLRANSQPCLKLDLRHLADHPAPLLKITQQPEHGKAMFDSLRVLTMLLRTQLPSIVLQARKPDLPAPREVKRLPPTLPGVPAPEITELPVDELDGKPITIRLTRYAVASDKPPVLMIHGYSASGTTYAHQSLQPSLAEYMHRQQRDVWVLDMRCSVGLETACQPWTFEHMAYHDIPVAVEQVLKRSGAEQLDVVAHCMGAAMFSMAVLSADQPLVAVLCSWNKDFVDRHEQQRRALPQKIRSVVLSQVGPVMVLSDINVLRAYVASFVSGIGTGQRWQLRPDEKSAAGDLLDRILATLPYADDDILKAWPKAPWVKTGYFATRARMDALYGETFKLSNLSSDTLEHLDDFFGTLSLETVTQVLHFAREFSVTNRAGENRFVSKRQLERNWIFPTLAIHGAHNGLIKPVTLQRLKQVFQASNRLIETELFDDFGHQDCLIGERSEEVFARMESFLLAPGAKAEGSTAIEPDCLPREALARGPWIGPVRYPVSGGQLTEQTIGLGAAPSLGQPLMLVAAPVRFDGVQWRLINDIDCQGWAIGESSDWRWLSVSLAFEKLQAGAGWALMFLYDQPDVMLINGFDFGLSVESGACLTPLSQTQEMASHCGQALTEEINRLKLTRRQDNSGLLAFTEPDLIDTSELLRSSVERFLNDSALAHSSASVVPFQAVDKQKSSILFGSCQYPHGILDQHPAYSSWQRAAAQIEFKPIKPEAIVLAGDQIYSDASAGLFDPDHLEDRYEGRYHGWLRQYPVRNLLRQLPLLALPDDHEFNENWEPLGANSCAERKQEIALSASVGEREFFRYQRGHTDDLAERRYDFASRLSNGVPMYLFDTRAQRQARSADCLDSRFISEDQQVVALEQWLLEQQQADPGIPKIIVAPSVLLPRVRAAVRCELANGAVDSGHGAALAVDSWAGYPQSWMRLLDFIVEHNVQNVLLLSGDEHVGLYCHAMLSKGDKAVTIHAVHSPGLYTPYDFVNGNVDKFVMDDEFSFSADDGQVLHCQAVSKIVYGNGFIHLDFEQINGNWHTNCRFDVTAEGQETEFNWRAADF